MQNVDVVEKSFELPERAVELLIKYRLEVKEFPLDSKSSNEVVKVFWDDIALKLFKEGYVISTDDCAKIWKVLYEQYTDYVVNNVETKAHNVKYLHIFKSIDKALKGEQSLKSNNTYISKNVSNYSFNPVYNNKGKEGGENGNKYITMKQTGNCFESVPSNDVISINETEKAVNSIRALSISESECSSSSSSSTAHANFNNLNRESGMTIYSNWVDDQTLKWNNFTKSTETCFVWDNDSFQCFMDLGLHVEKLLRSGKLFHDNPYTYISTKMYLYGYMISGEECQKKWKELAMLYGEQLDIIKETGILENQWKKFWQMDRILQESKLNIVAGPLSFVWTKNAIIYLINMRLEADIADVKFQGYIELWQYVASKMISYNFPFTYNECSIKWTELCEIYEESLKCVSERNLNVNWDIFLAMHLGYIRVASKIKQMIKCRVPKIEECKETDNVKSASPLSSLSNKVVERNLSNENKQNSYEAHTHFASNTQNMLQNIYAKAGGLATKRKSLIASDMVAVEIKSTADGSNVSQDTFDLNKVKRQKTCLSELSFIMKKSLSEQEANNLQMSDTTSFPNSTNNNFTNEIEQRTFGNSITQACEDQNINVQTSAGQNSDSAVENLVSNEVKNGSSNVTLPLNANIAENNNYQLQEKSQALHEVSAQDLTSTWKKSEKLTANIRANSRMEEETMTFKWTEDAMILLTRFRLEWELEFQILHTKRYNVWHDVAKAMQSLNYNVSSFLCESCWKHLICIYYNQYNCYDQNICLGYSKCFKIINDALLVGIYNLESPRAQLDAVFPKLGRAKSFWTDEAIRLLINLRFSKESPKIGTMTWVTMKMQSMGYRSLTIAQCCRKWRTLYSTYKNMHIRLCQGKVVNWPYFNIMDWNLKRSGKDLRSQLLNMNVMEHFTWSDAAVRSLINGISLLQDSFEESESNLSEVQWRQIANMLIARKFQVTPQQCAEKWNSLIDAYKKTIHELHNGKGVNLEEHFMLLNKWMKKKRS